MVGVFLKPRISPLMSARIGDLLLGILENEEDIHEGLKALADEQGTVTWEQYKRQRAERELQGELSG